MAPLSLTLSNRYHNVVGVVWKLEEWGSISVIETQCESISSVTLFEIEDPVPRAVRNTMGFGVPQVFEAGPLLINGI
ncbi:hypothetical protein TNCV_1255621 [Trichonephila clavipes]|nr:hypothetical protein TNCV_1255621 [Trichonephila clavipes]